MFQGSVFSSISNLLRHVLRQRNILALGRLVATNQQDNEFIAARCAIEPVARAVVDLQFEHAGSKLTVLAWIAFLHAPDSDIDSSPCLAIAKGLKPGSEAIGLANFDHCKP